MYWRILSLCLMLALIVLAINHSNFNAKYIYKNEAVKTLLAYSQTKGEFNNQIIKDFNVFCPINYEALRFLGLKRVKEISVNDNINFLNDIYVQKKCVHDFFVTKKYAKYEVIPDEKK